MTRFAHVVLIAALTGAASTAVAAPVRSLAVRDSFRVGTAGVLCTAQLAPLDPALKGMFDRGYGVVCRDAAAPVGNLHALRGRTVADLPALLSARPESIVCEAADTTVIDGLGPVSQIACSAKDSRLAYRGYAVERGGTLYAATGLGGYDSALRLGLRSIVSDRPVDGAVEVATTSVGDPAAFARVQAGALDSEAALTQAYERNNAGSFAESAEFFDTLVERNAANPGGGRADEYLIGQAVQQSNLGNFAAADRLFSRAAARGAKSDAVSGRLLRNYQAIHRLNQRQSIEALAMLDQPVVPIAQIDDAALAAGVISPQLSDQINRANASLERIGGVDSRLRPSERAEILDGQAQQLRGIALRLQGRYPQAIVALGQASRTLAGIRGGRVVSTAFMRSEIFGEMALIGEARQDYAGAERNLESAVQILDTDYPQSAAGLAARARLAGYLARRGQDERAITLYGEIVVAAVAMPGSAASRRTAMAPYFALLAPRVATDPQAAEAMFAAAQILVRPGVAQTQAVLARELSSGDDEAATLFRQSVSLSRDVARGMGEVSRLVAANPAPASAEAAALEAARLRLTAVQAEQTALTSRLAQYPRYRVLSPAALTIADLRATMRADEAYYLLRVIGQDVYAMMVTPKAASAVKVDTTARALEADVAHLRETIVTVENGQVQTFPFDVALARKLYVQLVAPVGASLAEIGHLIYEPDGPMLQLPATLLVTEQAGVDAYATREKAPDGDPFDYRGVAWLGRDRDVSTAVSPRSFADVRATPPSKGRFAYLGLGENAVPSASAGFLTVSAAAPDDCAWPAAVWQRPIAATELKVASGIIGQSRSALLIDAAFTDTALKARTDLNQYRVLHFATHGLVSAPRPQCPARPALVTSFGDAGSDGLLSFREIYDLHLDADVVVLSACDTAGTATIDATREAGVSTGGNFALDGLVRAFVGAGARSVIASHWPIPDDYDATKRLMSDLFTAPAGSPMATALRNGQRKLMAQAETSHPFYWAAFAIIGDGEQPLLRK